MRISIQLRVYKCHNYVQLCDIGIAQCLSWWSVERGAIAAVNHDVIEIQHYVIDDDIDGISWREASEMDTKENVAENTTQRQEQHCNETPLTFPLLSGWEQEH